MPRFSSQASTDIEQVICNSDASLYKLWMRFGRLGISAQDVFVDFFDVADAIKLFEHNFLEMTGIPWGSRMYSAKDYQHGKYAFVGRDYNTYGYEGANGSQQALPNQLAILIGLMFNGLGWEAALTQECMWSLVLRYNNTEMPLQQLDRSVVLRGR